jgi:hypothetical protein
VSVLSIEPILDFYETQYGGHATEGDLDTTIFSGLAATIQNGGSSK